MISFISYVVLTADYSIFVAVIVSISAVWQLSSDVVTYVTDSVLNEATIDMQTCLHYVGMATCQPGWFTADYVPKQQTSKILSFIGEALTLPIKE